MLAPILKAYTSPDRSVRMMLLELLPSYVERVPSRKASENIWPNLITGFADSSAAIREATLRSVLPLSPKLTDRIRNNDLLRQLAKTQVDVEAGIRTNTTILLGRLAPTLNIGTRKSVLIPAFSRSLKDPFVHARVAGLMALMATSDSYDKDDLARSVLPAVSPNLVDKEKLVRDQAEKALEVFWAKIREEVKLMPESVLPTEGDTEAGFDSSKLTSMSSSSSAAIGNGGSKGGAPGGLASTAGGAATALAGWAMSGAMTYLSSDATGLRPSATPSVGSLDNHRPPLLTNQSTGGLSSRSEEISRSSSPLPDGSNRSQWAGGSAGGSASSSSHLAHDLIDINDDTSDWSSFETAPTKKPVRRGLPGSTGTRGAKSSLASSPLSTRPATTSSRKEMSSLAQEKLKMREDAVALDAWEGENSWEAGGHPTVVANHPDNGVSKSAAAAFNTPVPAWSAPGPADPLSTKPRSSPGTTERETSGWSSFPDEDGETVSVRTESGSGSQAALNKEEKRAQMEKQREERRERMRKLKESKGKKLGDSLA